VLEFRGYVVLCIPLIRFRVLELGKWWVSMLCYKGEKGGGGNNQMKFSGQ